ncbi:DNA-directed RNA polymerase I subunit RPA49, partial [Phenoliferia sp. Uapishka_3]
MSARKRQKGESGQVINVSVAADVNAPGPAFALFPAATPPTTTPFQLYSQGGATNGEGPTVLAGETPDMEYDSRNQMGVGIGGGDGQVSGEGQGYSVEYMLGVHDPKLNTLTLHSAPLHTFSASVKALKSTPATITSDQYTVQKALLGTTFGTKKAIRSINAQARNKLDSTSFGTTGSTSALQSLLQNSIQSSTTSLPTSVQIEHSANLSRPIPPPNFEATKPDDVYNIDDVVTAEELALLPIKSIIKASGPKERNAFLPFRRSNYITNRLREILPSRSEDAPPPSLSKKDTNRLKLLIHLSHLFGFRQATMGGGRNVDVVKLKEKMSGVEDLQLAGLVERYSEVMQTGNGEERKVTTGMELKLLGYMLVVVLKVDGWSTDVMTIATDLGMGGPKVQEIFKSLGCQMMSPSADERAKLIAQGAATTEAEARKAKRAVLKVPLVFPTERRGIPKR